jgi:hypothetical protein
MRQEAAKVFPRYEKDGLAVELYKKAADQGSAQFKLGACYAHGRGVAKDEVLAVEQGLATYKLDNEGLTTRIDASKMLQASVKFCN